MVIYISNFLIKKYKGTYTLKCEFDKQLNDFNRKLNGTYEDIDVYIKCSNNCKIFYYGNRGTLQFYCPSLQRGRNMIKQIYATYINPQNITSVTNEIERDGNIISRTSYQIVDNEIFKKDISEFDKIIFDIEETDSEVLFKFKYQDMNKLKSILKPSTIACNRSPFSTKNLLKSNYTIPDEDLKGYKLITANLPQNCLITLVHTSKQFMNEITKSQKQITELNKEMKQLGMKPKEFYHYKGWWDDYLKYLQTELEKEI